MEGDQSSGLPKPVSYKKTPAKVAAPSPPMPGKPAMPPRPPMPGKPTSGLSRSQQTVSSPASPARNPPQVTASRMASLEVQKPGFIPAIPAGRGVSSTPSRDMLAAMGQSTPNINVAASRTQSLASPAMKMALPKPPPQRSSVSTTQPHRPPPHGPPSSDTAHRRVSMANLPVRAAIPVLPKQQSGEFMGEEDSPRASSVAGAPSPSAKPEINPRVLSPGRSTPASLEIPPKPTAKPALPPPPGSKPPPPLPSAPKPVLSRGTPTDTPSPIPKPAVPTKPSAIQTEEVVPLTWPADKTPYEGPDDPSVIVFDVVEENQPLAKLKIKAATIEKLIEKATHPKAEPAMQKTFLLTYRSIVTPLELLELLKQRYSMPLPEGNEASLKTFQATYQKPIQLR